MWSHLSRLLDPHPSATKGSNSERVWKQGDPSTCTDLCCVCSSHNQCTYEMVLAWRLATTDLQTGGSRRTTLSDTQPAKLSVVSRVPGYTQEDWTWKGALANIWTLQWSAFSNNIISMLWILFHLIFDWSFCFYSSSANLILRTPFLAV